MSRDPRHTSSPPCQTASSPSSSGRPAAQFYRARVVDIKRRTSSASPSASVPPVEQRYSVESPRYRSSPSTRAMGPRPDDSGTASMSSSPRRTRNYALAPPPPPPHQSPSQRSVSIAQGSYMDYDYNAYSSTSSHASQPYHHSTTPPLPPRQRDEYGSRGSPTTAVRGARDSQGEVGHRLAPAPHQSARPPAMPQREAYDPRRLLPTVVRPPRQFLFELEEDVPPHHSSQPDIPGRFPSSPDTMEDASPDTLMVGVQDRTPNLRPRAGSYRELEPYELGMIYSNPAPYESPAPFSDFSRQNHVDPAEPFIYEARSPRERYRDGSGNLASAANQVAYSARNPAQEAEMYPLLRRLGADERYATSFRSERGAVAEFGGVPERSADGSCDGKGAAMTEVRTAGGIDVRIIEIERRRAERRSRR